jgi:hypothetical protein
MKIFTKKIWFWLFIIALVIIGSYLILNQEAMSQEETCYTNSEGHKVCVSGSTRCTYFADGSAKCSQGATSCTQYKKCNECVNGLVSRSNSKCYWNEKNGECGSFLDQGYSSKCSSTSDQNVKPEPSPSTSPSTDSNPRPFIPPEANPVPSSDKEPVPANCSSLLLLEGPVYVDPSAIPKKYREKAPL